jgi:predicted RNase H-like HicB family nuclease
MVGKPNDDGHRAYHVLIYMDDEGLYNAVLPSLVACRAQGASVEAVIANICYDVETYLKTYTDRGEPLPEETHNLAYVATEITPPLACDSLKFFVPNSPQPLTPTEEAWARQVIQELRDAGRVH